MFTSPHLLIATSALLHVLLYMWLRDRERTASERTRTGAPRSALSLTRVQAVLVGGWVFCITVLLLQLFFVGPATSWHVLPLPSALGCVIGAFVLPPAAILVALALGDARRTAGPTSDPPPPRFVDRLAPGLQQLSIHAALWAFTSSVITGNDLAGMLLAGGFLAIVFVANFWRGYRDRSSARLIHASIAHDLEASPLFAHLAALAARFVFLPRGWMLAAPAPDDARRRRRWSAWWSDWSPNAPTIPVDLVRAVSGDTITAAVALRYCLALGQPKKRPIESSTAPARRWLLLFIAPLLGLMIVAVALAYPNIGMMQVIPMLMLVLVPYVSMAAVSYHRGDLTMADVSTIQYRNALALWTELCAPADPSPLAFVLHLHAFDRLVHLDTPPSVLRDRMRSSLHVMRLLGGKQSPEFAALAAHLGAEEDRADQRPAELLVPSTNIASP